MTLRQTLPENKQSRVTTIGPLRARFGVFELDRRSGELRKHNHKIRLQDQPLQILLALLERPGEMVLREDIRRKLWPDNTTVEFDHGINAAVKRLRDSLQDTAKNPHFVETIGRRGYRFVAPVTLVTDDAPEPKGPPLVSVVPKSQAHAGKKWQDQPASVAVLPFANMTGEAENEYFSDGLAEELINELAQLPGLRVIARTSAFAFKDKAQDIRKIAKTLGVEHLVEGSVRRSGSQLRITAQLIAAQDGTHVWSGRYDTEMADIFAIQENISSSIAGALRVQLALPSKQPAPRLPSYEAYLKARHCLTIFTRECLTRSRDFYEQSIALDPGFAAAHSGLAMALVSLVLPGILPAHTAMPLARAAAGRALAIDSNSEDAHAVLGMVAALYDRDWESARSSFQLATARKVVSPYVRWYYSFSYLLPVGQSVQSVEECLQGMEADPLNFIGGFHYAGALLAAGNSHAGQEYLRELSELHVNLYQPYYLLALTLAAERKQTEAVLAAEKAYELAPWSGTTKGLFGGLLKATGKLDRAEQLCSELLPAVQYGAAMALALFHFGCDEMDVAAGWLERASEERDTRLILLLCLVRASRPEMFRDHAGWLTVAKSLKLPPVL